MPGRKARKGAKPVKSRPRATTRRRSKPQPRQRPSRPAIEKALAEALEQQAATGEILRVISSSPDDAQPVFDTIAKSAARLCKAEFCHVFRFDGEHLHFAAHHGLSPKDFEVASRVYPMKPGRRTAAARSILSGAIEQIPDVLKDREFVLGAFSKRVGQRSVVAVPMLKQGSPIGSIAVVRSKPGLFPERQIALLQTFADQAVIAIENVRLFKELEARNRDLTEALEQQTATGEVLKVISRSSFDLQPVLQTVIDNAVRVCGAEHGHIHRYDGEFLRLAAGHSANAEMLEYLRAHPSPLRFDTISGRAGLERRPIHCDDVLAIPDYQRAEAQRLSGFRTLLAVPILSADALLGVIMIWKTRVEPFREKQIELVKAFADQAVIAIENVRLFKELEARNRDLTEALEQQTATSEILGVISKSQTDVQPVFDTIARAARELCQATSANVFTYDGDLVHAVAVSSPNPQYVETIRQIYPRRPGRDTGVARAIQSCSVVMIPDVLADQDYVVELGAHATAGGFRSVLAVPLMREGRAVGGIAVGRPDPGRFPDAQVALLKTFADQAVIAIENMRLFKALEARNRDLTEALEQQTATSEILRVISQSPTDVQPVFDAITAAALKLCGGITTVARFDGELVHLVGLASWEPEVADANRRVYPRPPSRETVLCRAILTRDVVNIPDVQQDPDYVIQEIARAAGYRSAMAVPLLREGKAIGAIATARAETGPFSDKQIALLRTFADQAVIAIENVRLFRELQSSNRDLSEALEQQTATSEILRVISGSPTDVQPVFDTIVTAALKLCGAVNANLLTFDGELIHLGALVNTMPQGMEAMRAIWPRRPSRDMAATRAILTCSTVVIPDVLDDPDFAEPSLAIAGGFRSILSVPLVREGSPIGAIAIGRVDAGPFPDSQIQLLQTFADQAVIAIDNVRLFTELQARNREITEALEQQTATSEILRVISGSPRDVQPVFDAIANAALKLCSAGVAMVARYDGKLVELAAIANLNPAGEAALREVFPRPPSMETTSCRAVLTGRVEMIADVLDDRDYKVGDQATRAGFRSTLAVPLMRGAQPIGCITVGRPDPGPFGDDQVALLQTFADQAVIAIRNVQLFTELDARTAELSRSVGELKALGDVGQAVSSTLDLETVLRTIVSRATTLAGMDGGSIWEYDESSEEFHLHATDRLPESLLDAMRGWKIRKGEGALGRLAMTSEPVEIRDIADEKSYQSKLRKAIINAGFRSILAVPLVRESHLLGALAVNRAAPGGFAPEVVSLLQTFAAQSALAIQNARLFRELEVKSRELEAASRHKSEFLANMSHELRTPLNAIIGFSEVLAEKMFGEINEKQSEYLADILESGRHLLSLINDILDLSKIEAGRMELEPSDFDLPAAIENALILVRERAQRRAIKLGRDVDERLGKIRGDERKVKQVLLNLLSNALKFTPEGGRIDVRAAARDGVAEVSVSDTGVGIAPEDQEAVFEEFKQVGTASKKVEGTGLGLAISRKFIELHGGRMWVESQPGKGATFSFTLPHRH